MYNKTSFVVLNNLRAGDQVKLLAVVLFFSINLKEIEFKVLSRYHIPHSHILVCKKLSVYFVYLAQNTF